MQNRSGNLKTQLSGELQYKAFVPTPLQQVKIENIDEDMFMLLTKASRSLGTLEGVSSRIPNINLFISMYVRKEALLSSQIEGTQATLDDILDPAAEANQNTNVADVLNYIKASDFAMKRMETLPLCNRLLQETHSVLLLGIRGNEKSPGEFRKSQNWIGATGSTIKTASFIPPSPEAMIEAMSDLERYLNADDDVDVLVKAALIHYQFETIHPFLDGNGRIGRLLIPLFLFDKKILSLPSLYISYFLKLNRIEYYDRLMEVRKKGNYEQWVKFFLQAILQSSQDAIETIDQLTALREKSICKIATLGRAGKTAKQLYDYLERSPIIDIGKTADEMKVSYNTVAKAVENLSILGILIKTEESKRNRTFAYNEYLNILRKDT